MKQRQTPNERQRQTDTEEGETLRSAHTNRQTYIPSSEQVPLFEGKKTIQHTQRHTHSPVGAQALSAEQTTSSQESQVYDRMRAWRREIFVLLLARSTKICFVNC